ncbi:MAG: hypothetical protein ACFFBD_24895 [Candidatus Hodarchaeota archaeon]
MIKPNTLTSVIKNSHIEPVRTLLKKVSEVVIDGSVECSTTKGFDALHL